MNNKNETIKNLNRQLIHLGKEQLSPMCDFLSSANSSGEEQGQLDQALLQTTQSHWEHNCSNEQAFGKAVEEIFRLSKRTTIDSVDERGERWTITSGSDESWDTNSDVTAGRLAKTTLEALSRHTIQDETTRNEVLSQLNSMDWSSQADALRNGTTLFESLAERPEAQPLIRSAALFKQSIFTTPQRLINLPGVCRENAQNRRINVSLQADGGIRLNMTAGMEVQARTDTRGDIKFAALQITGTWGFSSAGELDSYSTSISNPQYNEDGLAKAADTFDSELSKIQEKFADGVEKLSLVKNKFINGDYIYKPSS